MSYNPNEDPGDEEPRDLPARRGNEERRPARQGEEERMPARREEQSPSTMREDTVEVRADVDEDGEDEIIEAEWEDVSEDPKPRAGEGEVSVAADVDGDGDTDYIDTSAENVREAAPSGVRSSNIEEQNKRARQPSEVVDDEEPEDRPEDDGGWDTEGAQDAEFREVDDGPTPARDQPGDVEAGNERARERAREERPETLEEQNERARERAREERGEYDDSEEFEVDDEDEAPTWRDRISDAGDRARDAAGRAGEAAGQAAREAGSAAGTATREAGGLAVKGAAGAKELGERYVDNMESERRAPEGGAGARPGGRSRISGGDRPDVSPTGGYSPQRTASQTPESRMGTAGGRGPPNDGIPAFGTGAAVGQSRGKPEPEPGPSWGTDGWTSFGGGSDMLFGGQTERTGADDDLVGAAGLGFGGGGSRRSERPMMAGGEQDLMFGGGGALSFGGGGSRRSEGPMMAGGEQDLMFGGGGAGGGMLSFGGGGGRGQAPEDDFGVGGWI